MVLKGQGAFEYMISYGWAILIVIVLGILLFSLGVLNPSQTPAATGFTVMRPVSWSFSGSDMDTSNVTLALENVAGQSLVMYVNDSTTKYSIKFKKGNSVDCYFNNSATAAIGTNLTVNDSSGNTLTVTSEKVPVPVGGILTVMGKIGGQTGGTCGGLVNSGYRYNVVIVAEDEYLVTRKDNGLITGKYV